MFARLTGRRPAVLADSGAIARTAARYVAGQAGVLTDTESLLGLTPALKRSLSTEFGVETLSARICPVELDDGSAAIFALAEHVGSDQADELARRLLMAGYPPADPARFVLNASMLAVVARDAFRPSAVSGHGGTSRGALEEAFHGLVEWGVLHGASDLHLNVNMHEAESEVKYTVCGRYIAPECFRRMPTRTLMEMLSVAWMDIAGGNGAVFDPSAEQQGSLTRLYAGREVMLRWASMASDRGPSVCLRLLEKTQASRIPSLESLGYCPEQVAMLERALFSGGGAVVFAGTVGSGKSTTLASLIARLPADRKVITVEDPVEYTIPGAIQNSIARRLDTDAHSAFATKLRALKRSAMTDVLLGEVRDRETGLAFMDLAGSGVNIYTTVHAPSAAFIPTRLASDFIGVSREFLATPGTLKLLVWQALLPRLCECAVPIARALGSGALRLQGGRHSAPHTSQWFKQFTAIFPGPVENLRARNAAGCPRCRQEGLPELSGYAGRSIAAEMFEPRAYPDWFDWVSRGAGGVFPVPMRSAMSAAMEAAYKGIFDPADVEVRFHSLVMESRLRSAEPAFIVERCAQPAVSAVSEVSP